MLYIETFEEDLHIFLYQQGFKGTANYKGDGLWEVEVPINEGMYPSVARIAKEHDPKAVVRDKYGIQY